MAVIQTRRQRRRIRRGRLEDEPIARALLAFNGYGEPDSQDLSPALRDFQRHYNIPITGQLDSPTCRLLNSSRCSHSDRPMSPQVESDSLEASPFAPPRLSMSLANVVEPELHVDAEYLGKDHPYELIIGRWSRPRLGYSFVGSEPPVLTGLAWEAIRRAFRTWDAVGVLSLSERGDQRRAELRVLWTLGPATDPTSTDPFYGPGGTAAFGYYPYPQLGELAGDLHLNLAQSWTVSAAPGALDIETVALHEIGHCLGLGHCHNEDSVMWPIYKHIQRALTSDDKEELKRQYRDLLTG
jgi:hypothetical protein